MPNTRKNWSKKDILNGMKKMLIEGKIIWIASYLGKSLLTEDEFVELLTEKEATLFTKIKIINASMHKDAAENILMTKKPEEYLKTISSEIHTSNPLEIEHEEFEGVPPTEHEVENG